jgi:superfamily II DNA or RNA helicase
MIITKKNETSLYIDCEPGIMYELADFFCFFVPGYQHMPPFKSKIWDGKIRLFDLRSSTLPVGLYKYVYEFAEARGYNVLTNNSDYYSFPDAADVVDLESITTFIEQQTQLTSKGEVINPYDYQLQAISTCLSDRRKVIISPTASGKSLIIYLAIRWFIHNIRKPVIIVVPTTSLVEQMYTDFGDYSEFDQLFDVEKMCHRIYSGQDKKVNKPITISTWQSIYQQPAAWFQKYGMVVGDEAHNFKAKSLTTLMNKCTEASYRFGTTGTLDGTKTHKMVLEGLFGPIHRVTTTKALMKSGQISDLNIKLLLLKYSSEECAEVSRGKTRMTYPEEIAFITQHDRRNNFISNLALSLEGNTLVLFNLVEKHGRPLFERIKAKVEAKYPGRNTYFVSGNTSVDIRENIRSIVEKEADAIVVASLGTFSTGINIKNLHNIIFASPSKSQIKILQSIGRSLRIADNGRSAALYDIADDLHWKSRKNHTLGHAAERIQIYNKEMFTYKVIEVPLTT